MILYREFHSSIGRTMLAHSLSFQSVARRTMRTLHCMRSIGATGQDVTWPPFLINEGGAFLRLGRGALLPRLPGQALFRIRVPFFFDPPARCARSVGFARKSLFMKVTSARSPATFGLWPAKEFKLANFWDANKTNNLAAFTKMLAGPKSSNKDFTLPPDPFQT
jgi:hypothetical protein